MNMGLGQILKNQVTQIGYVTGSAWPQNSVLKQYIDQENHKEGLTISWPDGEMTFFHEDVKYACICAMGVCDIKSDGKLDYGIKYKVELNDGRVLIITTHYGGVGALGGVMTTTPFIERVIF